MHITNIYKRSFTLMIFAMLVIHEILWGVSICHVITRFMMRYSAKFSLRVVNPFPTGLCAAFPVLFPVLLHKIYSMLVSISLVTLTMKKSRNISPHNDDFVSFNSNLTLQNVFRSGFSSVFEWEQSHNLSKPLYTIWAKIWRTYHLQLFL